MKYIKSIFAVSIVAMAVVGNARASIVSQTNIVGGSNVSVEVPPSGTNAGKVVISATDTKYTTGTTTYSGTTKLYEGTGSETDGTLTQQAITDALSGKQDKSAMVGSNSDKLDNPDNNINYPTVAAVYTITTSALGNQVNNKLDKTFTGETDKSKAVITNDKGAITTGTISSAMITDGAVTSDKIANGTIVEVDLSDAVKTKLNAAVQTVEPTSATTGKYVTNLTKDGTTVKVETAYVQIPVGSATAPTSVASIWVE